MIIRSIPLFWFPNWHLEPGFLWLMVELEMAFSLGLIPCGLLLLLLLLPCKYEGSSSSPLLWEHHHPPHHHCDGMTLNLANFCKWKDEIIYYVGKVLNQVNMVVEPVRKTTVQRCVCVYMGKEWVGRKRSNSLTPRFPLAQKWPKKAPTLGLSI